MKKYFGKLLLSLLLTSIISTINAQGTWTQVATIAPHWNGGEMMLLSDGSVIAKTFAGNIDSIGNIWDRLTPDIHGSYVNGTWSQIAPMYNTRLYFSSQILKDGRVYVAGGEYGSGYASGEVYNPINNTWTMTPPPGMTVSDANSEILDNGKVINALVDFAGGLEATAIYNPDSNTYVPGPSCLGIHNESAWVKLADNSILFVDRLSTNSERYIPSLNQWVADATVPVGLYDPYGDETGAAFLLPDGRAFFIGSQGQNAYYTPSGNSTPGTWAAAPSFPNGRGAPDAAGAMLVNGKILCAVSPAPDAFNVFHSPTYYYEFSYATDSFTQISAPGGSDSTNEPCYYTGMLDLPDGTIMYADQASDHYYIYTPDGSQIDAGKPVINNIIQTSCDSFIITGTGFNGISEGAGYGDDWQMATNYPVIRLTSGTNVYYARSYNWNHTGVQTGSLADTARFVLPTGLPTANYSLVVTANGIHSDSVLFNPFPVLSSSLTPPAICSNEVFTYTPSSNSPNPSFTWTRDSIPGIMNPPVTQPQTTNPNETLVNSTTIQQTVIYKYTITSNGCVGHQDVAVVVNPTPVISMSGVYDICIGDTTSYIAGGGLTYLWSTGSTNDTIHVSPLSTTTYSVTGTNTYGCTQDVILTLTVNPLPTISISGDSTICKGDLTTLTVNGGDTYVWSNSSTDSTITVNPNLTTTYTVTGTSAQGCASSDAMQVVVTNCTGISETASENALAIYPNPADEKTNLIFTTKEAGNYSLKLIDVYGRLIKSESIEATAGENTYSTHLNGLAKGLYMITLQKGNEVLRARLVLN